MMTYAAVAQRMGRLVEQPLFQRLKRLLPLLAAIGAIGLLFWLPGVERSLAQRELAAGEALNSMQNDLAELERLKERPLPAKLSGTLLKEAVAASLAATRATYSVDLVDADRVRVQGGGDFDSMVRWLGDLQRSHRLGVVALAVARSGSGVTVDVTLSANRE